MAEKQAFPLKFCLANTSVPLDAAAVPKQRELLEHLFERYRKELRPVYDESTVRRNVKVNDFFVSGYRSVRAAVLQANPKGQRE